MTAKDKMMNVLDLREKILTGDTIRRDLGGCEGSKSN